MVFIAKFLLAILAFLVSILAYVLFTSLGTLPQSDEKPDREDITWTYVGKALAGAFAVFAALLWYLVFAI